MNIKYIFVAALVALALGLAAIRVAAPTIAGGRGGLGGEVHAGVGVPAVAASRPGMGGDFEAEVDAPRFSVAGAKRGIASGAN